MGAIQSSLLQKFALLKDLLRDPEDEGPDAHLLRDPEDEGPDAHLLRGPDAHPHRCECGGNGRLFGTDCVTTGGSRTPVVRLCIQWDT